MINLNSDITNILQIDSSNVISKNENSNLSNVAEQNQKEIDEATTVSISEQALSQINNLMSKENTIAIKMTKSQIICDSLADIRLKLQDLRKILNDPEMNYDISLLKQVDSLSNSLIESVIKTVKDNDDMNIVDSNIINVYMNGLQSIKQLDFIDDNFFTKLQSIENNVKTQEKEYFSATESLYQEYMDITKKYEETVDITINDFKDIDKQIIKTAEETLAFTSANLTPEVVYRLLQGNTLTLF